MLPILSVNELRASQLCVKIKGAFSVQWRMIGKTQSGIASVWSEWLEWHDYDCDMIYEKLKGVQTNDRIQIQAWAWGWFSSQTLGTYTFDHRSGPQYVVICGDLGNMWWVERPNSC